MNRTPAHVADMLGFVRELRTLVGTRSLENYLSDRVLNLAVEKLFINLGEAAVRVPEVEPGAPGVQTNGAASPSTSNTFCTAGRASMRCWKAPSCGSARAGHCMPRVQRLSMKA